MGLDRRVHRAYAGSATMVMPEDFLAALQNDPAAHAFYATLKRQSQFTIYQPPAAQRHAF